MNMARPERFELPTSWFVATHSIQLSYGRVLRMFQILPCEKRRFEPARSGGIKYSDGALGDQAQILRPRPQQPIFRKVQSWPSDEGQIQMAEREGFEPSMGL
jgi:hypothetical protein